MKLTEEDVEEIKKAFKAFKDNTEVIEKAIKTSTRSTDGCYLELMPDNTYRLLWFLGNRYYSPGTVISIPKLSDEDGNYFFDNTIDSLEIMRGKSHLQNVLYPLKL